MNPGLSKKEVPQMGTKVFVFLLIVLGINSLRYGTYLLEGSTSIYYSVCFALNVLSLLAIIILRVRRKETVEGQ